MLISIQVFIEFQNEVLQKVRYAMKILDMLVFNMYYIRNILTSFAMLSTTDNAVVSSNEEIVIIISDFELVVAENGNNMAIISNSKFG